MCCCCFSYVPTAEVMPEVAGNTRNGEYLRCLYYNPQNECVQAAAVRVVPVRVNLPTIITLPQLKVSMKPIVLHLYLYTLPTPKQVQNLYKFSV